MPVSATHLIAYNGSGNNYTTRTTASFVLPAGAYLSLTMALSSGVGSTPVTVTDSAGGTWVQMYSFAGAVVSRGFWRKTPGTGTAISLTIVTTSSANAVVAGTYFTGASGHFSVLTLQSGTTAYHNATTPTATKPGDLYVANVHGTTNGDTTFTATTGWTKGTAATFSSMSRAAMQMWRPATASTTIATGSTTSSPSPTSTYVSTFVVYEARSGWGIYL